jgi:hypothetical protein
MGGGVLCVFCFRAAFAAPAHARYPGRRYSGPGQHGRYTRDWMLGKVAHGNPGQSPAHGGSGSEGNRPKPRHASSGSPGCDQCRDAPGLGSGLGGANTAGDEGFPAPCNHRYRNPATEQAQRNSH